MEGRCKTRGKLLLAALVGMAIGAGLAASGDEARAAAGDLTYRDCITSNSNVTACTPISGAAETGLNTGLDALQSVAISPDGASLYAAAFDSDAVAHFTRNPVSGALDYQGCITSDTLVTGCTQIPGAAASGDSTGLNGILSIGISPDGANLYAASNFSTAVARFDRNPTTGALAYQDCVTSNSNLTACTPIPGSTGGGTNTGLSDVRSLALSPDGASLYTASNFSDAISSFTRDPVTGALTYEDCITSNLNVTACTQISGAVAGGSNTGLDSLTSLASSPDGASVYTVSLGDAVAHFTRDPATGALAYQGCVTSNSGLTGCTQIPGATIGGANTGMDALSSVAPSPDGANLYATSLESDAVAHFDRNPATGFLTYRDCITSNSLVTGCTLIPDAMANGSNTGLNGLAALALSPDGASLYTASNFNAAVARFTRNPATGALGYEGCITSRSSVTACTQIPDTTANGSNTGLSGLAWLALSPDGSRLYAASTGDDAVARFDVEAIAPPPPNNFHVKKPKLKPKKGAAVLPVVLPGGGQVKLLASKQVKAAKASRASAGQAKLTIKPKGKAKTKLKKKGKVKIKVRVTFTPSGGEPRTKTKQVTVKLKR